MQPSFGAPLLGTYEFSACVQICSECDRYEKKFPGQLMPIQASVVDRLLPGNNYPRQSMPMDNCHINPAELRRALMRRYGVSKGLDILRGAVRNAIR